ncbi:MAG: helix-turn-helix domain-containing protein [Raineya sp.]|nr:helix-turn-helix domain-containing protein [Raineya sp.]
MEKEKNTGTDTGVKNVESEKEFAERLRIIIDLKELQPSHFADEIGIQRSGLSHIIAGRNKPSVDFLQKLVQKFEDINVNWLLTGIGEPLLAEKTAKDQEILEANSEISTEIEEKKKEKVVPNKEKEIERIVVFYADKTFETFNLFNPYKPNNGAKS